MIQEKFRNGKITAWLLPVVLVLSLFTFSGINSPSTAKSCATTTEQIDPLSVSNKRCVSYKVFGAKLSSSLGNSFVKFQRIAVNHTNAVKEQIKQSAKLCFEFKSFKPSVSLYSPRSTDEDFRISQHG